MWRNPLVSILKKYFIKDSLSFIQFIKRNLRNINKYTENQTVPWNVFVSWTWNSCYLAFILKKFAKKITEYWWFYLYNLKKRIKKDENINRHTEKSVIKTQIRRWLLASWLVKSCSSLDRKLTGLRSFNFSVQKCRSSSSKHTMGET